jgi:hypothetical protein
MGGGHGFVTALSEGSSPGDASEAAAFVRAI